MIYPLIDTSGKTHPFVSYSISELEDETFKRPFQLNDL